MNGHIRPSSRPRAMEGSPEGRVPLALSAQDRPPRRRIKRKSPALTSKTGERLGLACILAHVKDNRADNNQAFHDVGHVIINFQHNKSVVDNA